MTGFNRVPGTNVAGSLSDSDRATLNTVPNKADKLVLVDVKTAAYTAAANQFVPVNTNGNPVTVSIPAGLADGTRVAVKMVLQASGNATTVALSGTEVLNKTGGSTSLGLSLLNQAVTLQKAGSIWYVQSDDLPLSALDVRFASADTVTTTLGTKVDKLVRVAPVTTSGTATANTIVPLDTTNGSLTETLPTAPATGTRIAFKHTVQGTTSGVANIVTIAAGGSDVFNRTGGPTSITLKLLGQAATVQYDAGIWTVVADDLPLSQLDARFPQIVSNTGPIAIGVGDGPPSAAILAAYPKLKWTDRTDSAGGLVLGIPGGAATFETAAAKVDKGSQFVSVNDYGAKPDCVTLTDGVMSANSAVLTSNGAAFTDADIGKLVLVKGASSSDGAGLRAIVSSRQSGNQVTLSANATVAVSGAQVRYGTDNLNAITSAWSAARLAGKTLVFVSIQTPYLSTPLEFFGDGTRIDGWGSKLFLALLPTDQTVVPSRRGGIYAYGNDLDLRNLWIEQAITYDTPQAGFGNYELCRIGGVSGGSDKYRKRLKISGCTFVGGGGCNVINTEQVTLENNKIYQSHGNSLGAVNCKGDVVITGNYCENGNDDLIAVTADSGTGQSTLRVAISNNTMRDGDAGGIKVAGADYVSVVGNHINNTYTAGVHCIQDTVYNLQPTNRVIISGNTVLNGGQCYGGNRYHATISSAARAIQVNSNAADCIVVGNILVNSANRGMSIQAANAGITITDNRVIGAGSIGMDIGNVSDTTYGVIKDVLVTGNHIRNTLGGINIGSGTNVEVSGNQIHSYFTNGTGQYRGIQYAYLKNAKITGNTIYNDDGGHLAIFESTANSCINLQRWGNLALPNTTQADTTNYFTIGGARLAFASAPPTAGTWALGDRVYNTAPVSNGPEGWVCTTAGTDSAAAFQQFGNVGAITATVQGVVKQRTTASTYLVTTGSVTGTAAVVAGRMYVSPIALQSSITGTTLNVTVTAAGSAGALIRLGLYADTGGSFPSSLVLDAGTIDATTTGNKSITISQSLSAGVYWLAAVVQGAPTTVPTVNTLGGHVPGVACSSNSLGNSAAGYAQDAVTAALPSTFGSGNGSQSNVIKIALGI